MPAGAKQAGTGDVGQSRNQASVLEDDREPQWHGVARESGRSAIRRPANLELEENSRFPTSQVAAPARPRCTGQTTLGTAQIMVRDAYVWLFEQLRTPAGNFDGRRLQRPAIPLQGRYLGTGRRIASDRLPPVGRSKCPSSATWSGRRLTDHWAFTATPGHPISSAY